MRIKKTHWKQQVNQNEAGIRNCMKPSPSIRLGIKVDDCDYQTIKYLVLIYKHGYQENQNTHFLHIIRVLNFWNFSNNCLKTIRSLPVLSWNLGVLWKLLKPRTGGSLNLIFFKYQDPVILWFWNFSNTRNQWFFGYQFFFKYPRVAGVTKCRYPPQAEVNVTWELIDTWLRLAYVFHHRGKVCILLVCMTWTQGHPTKDKGCYCCLC
jgi:hypothetical protein